MHTTEVDRDSPKHTDVSPLTAGAHFLIFKIESETGEMAQRAKELATKPDDLDPQNPHGGRREMIPTNPLTPPATHTLFFLCKLLGTHSSSGQPKTHGNLPASASLYLGFYRLEPYT